MIFRSTSNTILSCFCNKMRCTMKSRNRSKLRLKRRRCFNRAILPIRQKIKSLNNWKINGLARITKKYSVCLYQHRLHLRFGFWTNLSHLSLETQMRRLIAYLGNKRLTCPILISFMFARTRFKLNLTKMWMKGKIAQLHFN
jgi:hypothetical protein